MNLSQSTILPFFIEGLITLFMCSLLKALKKSNSDNGSNVFLAPETKNFLIISPSSVPPGSLVIIVYKFFFFKLLNNFLLWKDLPHPSTPSKTIKNGLTNSIG